MIKVGITYKSGRMQELQLDFKDFREAMHSILQHKWPVFDNCTINTDQIESIEKIV